MLNTIDRRSSATPPQGARVVVVGAGMGGLTSALLLAARGLQVTVVEKADRPGGKLREVEVDGVPIDSGPTVFTMRWVLEAIFAAVGARLDAELTLTRANILARHAWDDGSTFDLHADLELTAEAVARFAGENEARGYRAFVKRTAEVFQALNESFMENPAPSPTGLARSAGLSGLLGLTRIQPFTALDKVVGTFFRDPRLRQLFGRYATYCGSSPYLAPGPLMLIAQVEQMGVWLVEGGMVRIAETLERLARERGVTFRYGSPAARLIVDGNRAVGVELTSRERIAADAVVFNGDPAALSSGLIGPAAARAVPPWHAADRSLSALTWSVRAKASGFPLSRHTVFFCRDYPSEFADIFERGRLPQDPTVYVCAQDRDACDGPAPKERERLFLLVNAPARADSNPLSEAEIRSCEARVMARLAQAGLVLSPTDLVRRVTTPTDFSALFPATGGALYGRASHGWAASFQRPGARTRLKGLYLAGGGVHPGPGLPMAALSGRHAASAICADLGFSAAFPPMAMSGGMSMRSAPTEATH